LEAGTIGNICILETPAKEERAQREWHMSQYERRRRGNALLGDGPRLPSGGNTRVGQRGSGHLAVSSAV